MEDSEPQDDALAMAQAMGFSSFGTQNRPQKRRKFTGQPSPHPQAQSESQTQSESHPQSESQAQSGSHSQSGPQSPSQPAQDPEHFTQDEPPQQQAHAPNISHAPTTKADEISLDDDDNGNDGGENGGKQDSALATFAKPPLGANLPARPPAPQGSSHQPHQHQQQQHQQQQHQQQQRQHDHQQQQQQQRAHRPAGSAFNPRWYEGYYDPSSNQNPWVYLETSLGLEPRGPWLSRA